MNPIKAIVLALLIVPALAILAFPPADKTIPPGRVVVDYWEKWTADEERQMRSIVDEFNDTVGKDKNIFVRYVSTSSINQKTLVATAAGVPPDIAGLWSNNLAQFAELDALEPLDDLAAEHGFTADMFKPIFWNACHYNGHLYSMISTPCAIALHYNKKAFADNAAALIAAGLDPTRPPESIDELDRYAQALEQLTPGGQIVRAGYLPMVPGWYVNYTYMYFGGNIWDAKNHKFTFTDPKVVKAFEWLQSYSKRLGKDATNEFRSGLGNFDSPQNEFLAGSVLMEQQGPWMANYILNLKPSMDGLAQSSDENLNDPLPVRQARAQWAAAPFPSNVPGVKDAAYCEFDTLMIPRGAKHKKEAFEFIAYVNRQDVMERLCKMHSKISPLTKVSQDFLEHHKNPYIGVFEKLAASPNAQCAPQIPILPEVTEELNNLIQGVALLDAAPGPALEKLQVRLQAKYDTFMEKQRARHESAAMAQ